MPFTDTLQMMKDDPYTAQLLALVKHGLRAYHPVEGHAIGPPRQPAEPRLPVSWLPGVGPHGIGVAIDDEDDRARPAWTQAMIGLIGRISPMRDDVLAWNSDAARTLASTFGPHLPTPRFHLPAPNTAAGMARFVLQGLGAHRLERAGTGAKLDLSHLEDVPVRDGFQPYGGVATVDADGALMHIQMDGRDIPPTDPDFAKAAFRFRSGVLVAVTLLDHLGTTHYGVSNALLVATRRHLPPEHPLRRWLKPFLFRTGAINANSLASLIPDRAVVHRASAFTADGLAMVRRRMLDGARFQTLPRQLRAAGMHPDQLPPGLAARALWSSDALLYWERVERFVERSLEAPALRATPTDRASHAWWDDLARQLPGDLPRRDSDGLRDLLTWALFVVTALHGHVGHVAPYVTDPEVAGARTRVGDLAGDRRGALQLCTIATMTGLDVPTIDQDFSRLMPDAATREAAVCFRGELVELQAEIDARNAAREVPFPAFSPRQMPCSVSR